MADQVAIVTQTITGTGNFDFTDVTLTATVKAAYFIFARSNTDTTITAHGCLGVAMWANDGEVNSPGSSPLSSNYFRCLDAVNTADARGFKDNAGLSITENDNAPATDIIATGITAITNGVRMAIGTNSVPTSVKITAVIFAGIARAWAQSPVTVTTTSGHTDTGGASHQFQPDILIFSGSDGGFGASNDNLRMALGFVVGSVHSGAYCDACDRGTHPTDADGRVDGTALPYINATGRATQLVTITIDSTGFNRQVTTGAGSPDLSVLAIKFSEPFHAFTDNVAVSSSTGNQTFTTTFKPRIVLGMSTLLTTENADTDGATAATSGFFVFDQHAQRAYSAGAQEGVTVGNNAASKSIQGNFAVATILDTGGATAQQATFVSMNATSFTLNFSAAQTGFLTLLALEFGSIVSDTEQLTDSTAINMGLQLPETEQLTETLVFQGRQSFSDTEELSDNVAFAAPLPLSETEEIADTITFMSVTTERTAAEPAGWTY